MLTTLIITFISQTEESLSIIEECIEVDDFSGIRDQIHKISPSVEYFSGKMLAQIQHLRELVISKDKIDIDKEIDKIQKCFTDLKKELVCILDEIQTNSGHKVRG